MCQRHLEGLVVPDPWTENISLSAVTMDWFKPQRRRDDRSCFLMLLVCSIYGYKCIMIDSWLEINLHREKIQMASSGNLTLSYDALLTRAHTCFYQKRIFRVNLWVAVSRRLSVLI